MNEPNGHRRRVWDRDPNGSENLADMPVQAYYLPTIDNFEHAILQIGVNLAKTGSGLLAYGHPHGLLIDMTPTF